MMIAPTTLIAYQLILTEPELRAAIADPGVMLPHYQAALDSGKNLPGLGDLEGFKPDPNADPAGLDSKDHKPSLRTATIRVHSNEWIAFCTEFAKLYPHFQKEDGEPDKFHISLTALRCGFPEITESNFEQVVTALITHAQQQHPAPA